MSDNTSAPSTTGTPGTDSAAEGTGTPNTTTEASPVDYNSQINELIKKAGGLKFKASGKEHAVSDIDTLIRLAQKGKPIEESFGQLEQQRKQLEPIARVIQELSNQDPSAREQALVKLLGREQYLQLAEQSLRRKYQQEEEDSKLTENERRLRNELSAQKERLAEYEQMKEAQRQQEDAAKEQAVAAQYRAHITENVSKALQLMDLPTELNGIAVDFMKPIIRQMLSNNIPLDPEFLAERVGPMFDKLLQHKASKLEGEKLLKYLGDDVGKKYRQAMLAQMQPKQVAPPTRQSSDTRQSQPSNKDKGPPARFKW